MANYVESFAARTLPFGGLQCDLCAQTIVNGLAVSTVKIGERHATGLNFNQIRGVTGWLTIIDTGQRC